MVAWPDGPRIALKSVSSLKVLSCSWPVAQALLGADDDSPAALEAKLREQGVDDPGFVVEEARELGILLSEERLAEAEAFYGPWTWGPIARTLIFGYREDSFADPETEREVRDAQAEATTSLLPSASGALTELPAPTAGRLDHVLARRRSRRAFGRRPIDLTQLAACLQAGFGITGELVTDDGRKLPLTAAPASGGLNTFDAYVLSRNVEGLEPGTHSYLPQEHALTRQTGDPVEFDRLFGDQQWAAQASCAVVLVADLRRQASKYVFPTTVGAVLIEAGARAELILLQAEEASLSGVVVGLAGVGAFDRRVASDAGLWGETSMRIPVCAVLLGASQKAQ